jgi:SNF2 family DNA or RNA helicase
MRNVADVQNAADSEDSIVIPPELLLLRPAKPILLIVLPGLIGQWCEEIRELIPTFKPYVYYGDKRIPTMQYTPKVDGHLTHDHELFDADNEENARAVVVTSLQILLSRDSPRALYNHRIQHGWSREMQLGKASTRYYMGMRLGRQILYGGYR